MAVVACTAVGVVGRFLPSRTFDTAVLCGAAAGPDQIAYFTGGFVARSARLTAVM